MDRNVSERIALWWLLAALVATGGATAAWRLAFLAAPLLLFQVAWRYAAAAIVIAALPSALELALHGDWVGSLGGRLRLVVGSLVFVCAVGLGARLHASRSLRRDAAAALPWFAGGLLIQAVLRGVDLVPEAFQYLSGNHLSALISATFVFALGLRMTARRRLICCALLLIGLVATGSRWGIWTGLVFGTFMVVTIYEGAVRRLASIGLVSIIAFPWVMWSQVDYYKGGLFRALSGLSFVRPWTGLGPGGAEHLSLQFVERTSRLTHIESLPLDWSVTMGWPVALALIFSLIVLSLRAGEPAPTDRSGDRLSWLAAVGIIGLLAHDLFDFAIASGALTVLLGVMVGLRLNVALVPSLGGIQRVVVACLVLAGLAAAHHIDPMSLELNQRLEQIPERLGKRPFRYWMDEARRAETPQARVQLFSKALALAPGYRGAWFELGDALRDAGFASQGVIAYRRGLEAATEDWTGVETNAIARLPLPLILPSIGDHLGAARSVALHRSRGHARALRLVEQLDLRHADPMIRKQFLAGLRRAEHPNEVVVPMLWALTSRPPVNEGDGFLALLEVFRREPRVRSAALVLRMLERQPGHCVGLRHWPVNRLAEWHPISERLEQLCGRLLLGHGADLRLLNRLRELRLDAP